MPKRIQLKRVKGWRMPEMAVKVARPGKWGNPYIVPEDGTREKVTRKFEESLLSGTGRVKFTVEDVRRELIGRDLACFCDHSGPCHADVLLAVANGKAVM
jgi:hypothetical protein